VCHRCAIADELDDRLGATDRFAAPLVTLRAAILEADNPSQVRKWLRNSAAGRLITDIATGAVPLTHDGLDGYGPNRSVDHLRALLVAAGALPDEDRSIDRLERFGGELLTTVADIGDRKVLQSWLRWQLLPRLRARAATGASMAHSAANARRALRRSSEFSRRSTSAGEPCRLPPRPISTPGSPSRAPTPGSHGVSWSGCHPPSSAPPPAHCRRATQSAPP
jgi:hypothetical protein